MKRSFSQWEILAAMDIWGLEKLVLPEQTASFEAKNHNKKKHATKKQTNTTNVAWPF